MPARFGRGFDVLPRRADAVRGREQLGGGDDFVVAGAEQINRMAHGGKIDLPSQRDEFAGGETVLLKQPGPAIR
jgi:hypothetical protein